MTEKSKAILEQESYWTGNCEMTSDELYDLCNEIENTSLDIRSELKRIYTFWLGLYLTGFRACTPKHLTALYNDVLRVYNRFDVFCEDCQAMGGLSCPNTGNTGVDFEQNLFDEMRFEMTLMPIIAKSYEFSSGQSTGKLGICNDSEWYDDNYPGIYRELLRIHTVKPWEMPPVPEMGIPERPSVILKVLSLSDSAPRVSAGFDDVFCTEPIVRDLLVDEDVSVGDCIIVKSSGWEGFGCELQSPEYDGLAEPGCPCSDVPEVMSVEYAFDAEEERRKHIANHTSKWLTANWKVMTYTEILDIAAKYLNEKYKKTGDYQFEKYLTHEDNLACEKYESVVDYNGEKHYYVSSAKGTYSYKNGSTY